MFPARSLEELRAQYGARYKWLVLVTAMIGTMASILSSTIVNVAIPDLSGHFGLGQSRAQWVSSGFMVAMTMSMLLTPWLLERFGLRRTYAGVVTMLLCGGVIGGLARDYDLVLCMRVAEGLAAGVLQPIPAIIILRAFPDREQGRAMGVFGFGVVLAPALGPAIGGYLVELFGWRSIFFVVVPFCLAALAMSMRYLPAPPIGRDKRGLDLAGLLLVAVAILCLLNGLVHLQDDRHLIAAILLGVSAAAIAGFVWWQLHGSSPLMNLAMFGVRPFAMGALVAFIYGMALFGSTYLLPVYLQIALKYGPARAGMVLLPAGLALAVTIPLAGRLADRAANHVLVSIGLALLAASFALLATISTASPYWMLLMWALIGRIGLGFVLPSLNLGAMRGLARDQIPQGSAMINFMRQLGGAIGVSATGILLEWRLRVYGASLAGGDADAAARIRAFDETLLVIAVVCAAAIIAAWNMRPSARN